MTRRQPHMNGAPSSPSADGEDMCLSFCKARTHDLLALRKILVTPGPPPLSKISFSVGGVVSATPSPDKKDFELAGRSSGITSF